MANEKLKIDPEFKQICPALSKEEYELLEEDICREKRVHDAIVTWNDTIVDGHNRYEIAQKHDIKFSVRCKDFPDRDHAVLWIIRNQLYRRNLKQKYISLLRARLYREVKLPQGGDRRSAEFHDQTGQRSETISKKVKWVAADLGVPVEDFSAGHDVQRKLGDYTGTLIGDHVGVSEKTIRRDEQHLKSVEALHPTLRTLYEGDMLKVTQEDLKLLSAYDHESQLHLYKQVQSGKHKTLKEAIAADEVEAESSPQLRMEAEAKTLRSWAAQVRKMIDELPDSPWIDETTRSLIHGDLKSAGQTALSRVGAGMCPKCDAKGCKTCRKTGWLPKMELDSVR